MTRIGFYGYQTAAWNVPRKIKLAREDGDIIGGVPFAWSLAGPNGCHVHFYLPGKDRELTKSQRTTILNNLISEASRLHDVVSWSWSYEPATEVSDRLESDEVAEALGIQLADMLGLTPIRQGEQKGRFQTRYGTKTYIGLARTLARVFDENT